MKAVYIGSFGGPENLSVREVPDPPAPTGTQVLVRVRAAGLNRADLLQRLGLYAPPKGLSANLPGLEFAGEIEAIGEGVSGFRPGDRVFGITAGEAQAELLLTDCRVLAAIPDRLSFTDAAAIPEAFITAYDAVFTQAELKPVETLLVHAVGSGVGLAAVQMAKAFGSHVIGTSRTADKLERAKRFGLDKAILTNDPTKFASAIREEYGGVDVILDLVGGNYFAGNLECLLPKGRLMLVGLTSGRKAEFDLSMALSKRLRIVGTVLRGRSLEEKAEVTQRFVDAVLPLFVSGQVQPNVDQIFSIADVVKAHEYLESDRNFGKAVLAI